MGWRLSIEEVKDIVIDSLKSVADFDPSDSSILIYPFSHLNDFHKKVFLTKLKYQIINTKKSGNCYNIALDEGMFNDWLTVSGCIEYVYDNQEYVQLQNKIKV